MTGRPRMPRDAWREAGAGRRQAGVPLADESVAMLAGYPPQPSPR